MYSRVEEVKGRHGQTSPGEERGKRDQESFYRPSWKRKTCEVIPIDLRLADEPKESRTGTRRTETWVAPKHVWMLHVMPV